MSNLVAFAGSNLPSVQSLSTALRSMETENAAGSAILKMDRTGHWVFGAGEIEVESESTWAVNPFSFVHGFIAWGEGEVLGEKMVNITQPLPELDAAPAGAKRGWETQVGMSLKCLTGEDKGLEVRYSTTSVGGKRSVQALAVAIATQVDANQTKPVPVITLKKEFYQHKAYGKIYTPLFDVVEWVGLGGEPEEEVAVEVVEVVEETGRRRRSV
jgi:hypothetical protein